MVKLEDLPDYPAAAAVADRILRSGHLPKGVKKADRVAIKAAMSSDQEFDCGGLCEVALVSVIAEALMDHRSRNG